MSKPSPDETKLRIIIKQVVAVMPHFAEHGYSFDSVEFVPYDQERYGHDGFAYNVWACNAEGERVLGYSDVITMHICHGEPGSAPPEKYAQTSVSENSETEAATNENAGEVYGLLKRFLLVPEAIKDDIVPLMNAEGKQPQSPWPAYAIRRKGVPVAMYTTKDMYEGVLWADGRVTVRPTPYKVVTCPGLDDLAKEFPGHRVRWIDMVEE